MLSKTKRKELISYLHEMRMDNYSNSQVLEDMVKDGFDIKGYAEMTDEELITELEGYGFCEFCEECRADLAITTMLTE